MTATPNEPSGPTPAEIREVREAFGDRIRETPTWSWRGPQLAAAFAPDQVPADVVLKLELWQYTGTFKARGALLSLLALDANQRSRGVVAVSAGNHALATVWAAGQVDASATLVMPETADPGRIAACRASGATVLLVANVADAFAMAEDIAGREGRTMIHPFEGEAIVRGTATVGLELCQQAPDLDVVIVPIGGGGLSAGVACAVKQLAPRCRVVGVEPTGANSMQRSFAAGKPVGIEAVRTIADSLGAPHSAPYTFALNRRYVDELVQVEDDELRVAMRLLFREMKLAVEPAGAATTAALIGPLKDQVQGQRVGLIVCGTNTDTATFAAHTAT